MWKTLKNRNFSLLFAGNFVSRIGSTFYNFAVGWFILTLTASPLAMAIYIALGAIVELLASPIAGIFVDRLNKVRILYVTDYIRGAAVLIGGVLIFTLNQEAHLMVLLYAVTVILALNNALFFTANSTLVPEIVEDEQLNQANAFFSLINSIQAIIGVLLAGIFYTLVGIEMIFIINGISFIVSAFSEMFIRTPIKVDLVKNNNSLKADFIEGITYIKNKQGLMPFIGAVLFLNFAFAPLFANVIPYLYNLGLGKEPIHLAVANITFSAGMLLGGIVVGTLGSKVIISKSIRYGLTVTVSGLLVLALLMHLVVTNNIGFVLFSAFFLPLFFFLAFTNMFVNIPFGTGLARAVEQKVRGRVFSIINTVTAALMPVAFLIAGLVLEYANLSVLLLAICLLSLLPFLIIVFGKRINLLLDSL